MTTYHAGSCDVAVIGAGHAGIEAALAAARLGCGTILFTINMDAVGNLPCNPAIGGTGKGHLVRELDALGGEMGVAADKACIQYRMLNRGKGPAVHSLRAQADRRKYQQVMKHTLELQENLQLKQAQITEILTETAKSVFIPLTVGGGINTVDDFDRVLKCGADKVSVNSGAIRNPNLIYEAAKRYGAQCVVLSADVKRVDGVFRVFAKGGRENTGMEAIEWVRRCADMGAGEIVVNSIDTDGVKRGFDLEMLDAVCNAVSVPVIASGGAGCIEDFITLFNTLPKVDAGLAASIFHFGEVRICDLKETMAQNGIPARR